MTANFRSNSGKIRLPKAPKWAEGDDLSEIYNELSALMTKGEVFYSCLVQANTVLFEDQVNANTLISPAMIVYNHNRSELSQFNPEYLAPFAHYLFTLKTKEAEEVPKWLSEAVNVIKGERDRSVVKIAADGGEDYKMDLTMQSLLVFRAHLYKLRIGGGVIPIIAAPGICRSVMVLPCELWTKEFKEYWVGAF